MSILKYLATVFVSMPVLAQTNATFLLTSSNAVSPSSPVTTIEIWAMWDDPRPFIAFGSTGWDLTASDGEFFNPVNVLNGVVAWTGVITGNVISGATSFQLPGSFIPPSLDNPILMVTYDWTTLDFSQRAVSLDTSNTTFFNVFHISTGVITRIFPDFTPGSGVINVVPAPGVWIALALPLVAGRRRRG